MENIITSTKNEKLKNLVRLRKTNTRAEQGLIIVDGSQEIELALNAGWDPIELFYCAELSKNKNLIKQFSGLVNKVSEEPFLKVAYKENPDGYLALFRPHYLKLDEIKLNKNPLIIILESVEKPGNLGAIFRTAFAAHVDAIIINDPQTDLYNPNVIRASVGHIFTDQIVIANSSETQKWLKKHKIKALGTTITAKKFYHQTDLKKACAIIMGTEKSGLSSKWLKNIDQEIKIPMQAGIDSLNVSVSTAVIVYEAQRQRNFVDF